MDDEVSVYAIIEVYEHGGDRSYWVHGSPCEIEEIAMGVLLTGAPGLLRVGMHEPAQRVTTWYELAGDGSGEISFESVEEDIGPCCTYCHGFRYVSGEAYTGVLPDKFVQGVVPKETLRLASAGGGLGLMVPRDHAPRTASDGANTFNELYAQRAALFSALCRTVAAHNPDQAYRSWLHADGTSYDGHFLAGVLTPEGWVTFHCPARVWDEFRNVREIRKAPPWDGVTSKEAVERLSSL